MDRLAAEAVLLKNYYVLPVCSPTRTSIMSGMYPMRYGLQHQVIWSGAPAGLPTNITTLADHLTSAGFKTHAIGKWHAGYYSWQHSPTFRGFDSFLGYYGGGEGYFSHSAGSGSEAPGPKLSSGFDFRLDERRRCGAGCSQVLWSLNGSTCPAFATNPSCTEKYSTHVFTERAVSVIQSHANLSQPIFVYLAFQAVHAPDQVPQTYRDRYAGAIHTEKRITFGGMISAADDGIGNVSNALAARGMDKRLVTIVTTDNGGPSDQGPGTRCPKMSYCTGTGTSNWPLRGGKHTLWEGGVRGTALIHSRSLLPLTKPVNFSSLMHVSDWLPTIRALVSSGGDSGPVYRPSASSAVGSASNGWKLDGVSQWDAILAAAAGGGKEEAQSKAPPPRDEVLIFWDPKPIDFDGDIGDAPKSAIRVGPYKLILGPPGCPSSKIPPYTTGSSVMAGAATATAANRPTVQCQAAMNQWCNNATNVPGVHPHNMTHWIEDCGAPPYPAGYFIAEPAAAPSTVQREGVVWRCVHKGPDNVFADRDSCYATRDSELRRVWCDCDAQACRSPAPAPSGPDDPPVGPGDCVRDAGNSTRLYNVEDDPGEDHELSQALPAKVAELSARIAQLAREMPPPHYPDNDPAADPTLHGGAWTPWVVVT